MKTFKQLVLGGALAFALAGTAQASPINVGGVVWDPASPFDFNAFSIAERQFINPVTGVVSGYGIVYQMNGTGPATFCPGCELTFQFDNFVPVVAAATPTTAGQVIGYAGGTVNVYVDNSPEVNPFNPFSMTLANTGDGQLWLDLVGHSFFGTTLTGSVQGFGSFITGLTGLGLLDVGNGGGLADANFNTNLQTDGADLTVSNSFTQMTVLGNPLDAVGTGNFHGDTIPEPGTLALIGLGLLAAGALRRRQA